MTSTQTQVEDTAKLLAQVSLFRNIDHPQMLDIAEHVAEFDVQRGDVIVERGKPCTGFHSVLRGRVKLAFTSVHGSEKVLELVGAGQSFGEAMIFSNRPHIFTAQALEDTTLLHFPREAVLDAIDRHPRFARRMLEALSQRLHVVLGDVEAFSLNTGTQRVIKYLIRKVGKESNEVVLQTSKTVLASHLNLTPEHFSRILHDLVGKHLIHMRGRAISIPNMDKLRAGLY